MSIRARIVVAVALHQIDYAPDTKPGSKCYNKGLQNVYCAIEKCHKYILSAASAAVRQADKRRSAYAAAQKNRPLVKAAVPALRKSCGAAVFSCKGCGYPQDTSCRRTQSGSASTCVVPATQARASPAPTLTRGISRTISVKKG